MKILHINTFDHGGAATAAIRLHKALLSQGIQSTMLSLYKTNNSVPNSYPYVNPSKKYPGFIWRQYYRLKNKLLSKYTYKYINSQKLKNKTKGNELFSFNPTDFDITTQRIYQNADIIQLHWIAGFVDFRFFQKNMKPVLWTLHDMNPFTGGCHYSSGCEKYINECKDCPQLRGTINSDNSFLDQEYKISFLRAQVPILVAPSQWLMHCSLRSKLFKDLQNFHIPNCLDLSVFKPQNKSFCRSALNLPQNKKILLFVSDSVENKRKGFDILLKALSELALQNVHIVAVGDMNLPHRYQIGITYLGRISDERLMALAFSAADAFVLPSREDNLPNTMLESMACGTPVIGTPVGGLLDVIQPGFNGILSNDISAHGLKEAIFEFFSCSEKFNNKNIRKYIEENFEEKLIAGKYIDLYNSVLGQS